MNSTQVDELFLEAMAEPTAEMRAAFLDRACNGNAELREKVDALLAAHDAAGSFLRLPEGEATTPLAPISERPGTTIGRYKLLEQIGEGGFGVVFMADQEQPVRRRVAVKIIKLGMDTKQVVARFEAERQALAMMDHPNIAKIFDAGTTETGRPYFVMELVRGVPITNYCDQARLTTEERLAIFLSVCAAVQHAHQKGIIHRDLKPSNVLVTLHDDMAVPKVIDFGVAKATQARLTDRTLFTEFRQMIGTPSYMSPEQAQMSGLDVDTRSDVYSLGVLLYELLTGTTPIDAKLLGRTSYDDLRRLICEVEPPSPSQRLSSLTSAQLTTLAHERHCEPTQLVVHLRSDLDWIVMKCLEKDRSRRYESASRLAQDLQRFLNGEPVVARPPTLRYRLSKFVRRNKVGAFVAASIAAVAIAAVAIMVATNTRIRRESAAKELALIQKDSALKEKGAALLEKDAALQDKNSALELARQNESVARSRYYAAQMNLASQAVRSEQQARAVQLLETLRPKSDEPDLRSFEWYHLYHLTHGSIVCNWRASPSIVRKIAWSPDGALIVSTDSQNGFLRLWDSRTGEPRGRISTDSGWIWDLAFSGDGKILVGGAVGSPEVIVWDVNTRQELRRWLADSSGYISAIAVSSDGKLVASGCSKSDINPIGIVKLWDIEGKQIATLNGHSDRVMAVEFSPDGKTLASASFIGGGDAKKNILFWNLAPEPKKVGEVADVGANDLAFSDDGKTLWASNTVWGPGDPSIQEIDVQECAVRKTYAGHTALVHDLALIRGRKQLVSSSDDRTLRLWNVVNGQSAVLGAERTIVTAMAGDPTSGRIVCGDNEGWMTLRDLDLPSVIPTHYSPGSEIIRSIVFAPDDKLLLTGKTQLEALDSENLALKDTGRSGSPVAISQHCDLVATYDEKNHLEIWNRDSGATISTLDVGLIDRAKFSPNGEYLVTWMRWSVSEAQLWDTHSGKLLDHLKSEALSVLDVAFSPDSTHLAIASRFEKVCIYDIGQRAKIDVTQVGPPLIHIYSMVFSPNGSLLAIGLGNGQVLLYDVDKRSYKISLRARLEGHSQEVRSLDFSPDGLELVTASSDRTIRVWDVVLAQERVSFDLDATLLKFSNDGNRMAVVGWDGGLRILIASSQSSAKARSTWRSMADVGSPAVLVADAEKALNAGDEKLGLSNLQVAMESLNQEMDALGSDDAELYYSIALLRLKQRDIVGYQDTCRALLDKWDSRSNYQTSFWFGWTCGLGSEALTDLSLPLKNARDLVAHRPQNASYIATLGVLLYREGEYAEARTQLKESLRVFAENPTEDSTDLYPKLFLAMAEWRLGHAAIARELLHSAETDFNQSMASSPVWNRRATLEIFHDEATALIISNKPVATPSGQTTNR